jgi:hypothetical protein
LLEHLEGADEALRVVRVDARGGQGIRARELAVRALAPDLADARLDARA